MNKATAIFWDIFKGKSSHFLDPSLLLRYNLDAINPNQMSKSVTGSRSQAIYEISYTFDDVPRSFPAGLTGEQSRSNEIVARLVLENEYGRELSSDIPACIQKLSENGRVEVPEDCGEIADVFVADYVEPTPLEVWWN